MVVPGPASMAPGEVDRIAAAGDVPRDATVFVVRADLCGVTAGRCGLATAFGASTVMLGSWVAEPVAVCDIAVPLRLNNNAVDRIATAEGAARLDDILITVLPNPDINALSVRTPYHVGKAACPCPGPSTSLSPKRRSITGGVRCISRISARVCFEIFYVGPAGRYITLQNRMSLASLAAGIPIFERGEHTGAMPGRLVRASRNGYRRS